MSKDFERLVIPLSTGENPAADPLALPNGQNLVVENFRLRDGGLWPRPGYVPNADVFYTAEGYTGTSLPPAVLPEAVAASHKGSPMLLGDGGVWVEGGGTGTWNYAGMASPNRVKSIGRAFGFAGTRNDSNEDIAHCAIAVGDIYTAVLSYTGDISLFETETGQFVRNYPSSFGGPVNSTDVVSNVVGGWLYSTTSQSRVPVFFYIAKTGTANSNKLLSLSFSGDADWTENSVNSGANGTDTGQLVWAYCTDAGVYVAYASDVANPDDYKVAKLALSDPDDLTSALTTSFTAAITPSSTNSITAIAIGPGGCGNLVVAAGTAATDGKVYTKEFNTSLADQSENNTITPATVGAGKGIRSVVVGKDAYDGASPGKLVAFSILENSASDAPVEIWRQGSHATNFAIFRILHGVEDTSTTDGRRSSWTILSNPIFVPGDANQAYGCDRAYIILQRTGYRPTVYQHTRPVRPNVGLNLTRKGGKVIQGRTQMYPIVEKPPAGAPSRRAVNNYSDSTWFIVDVTYRDDVADAENGVFGPVFVAYNHHPLVAAGAPNSQCALAHPQAFDYNYPLFLTNDYTSYDAEGGDDVLQSLNRLERYSFTATTAGNTTAVTGGGALKLWDGRRLAEAGFYEIPQTYVATAAGGSLAGGDYTIAAVFTWRDYAGNVHRSCPSVPVTVTAVANQKINVACTTLQCSEKEDYTIDVYVSEADPTGDAPLYWVGSYSPLKKSLVYPKAQEYVTITVSTDPDDSQEMLYTTGGILPNFPPHGSDGGVVAHADRLWVASGLTVYPSKLILAGQGPAWNDALIVDLPADAVESRALVALSGQLFALCEGGVWLLDGGGPDNLAQGAPFQEPVKVSHIGLRGPRAWCHTPAGVVFQSETGGIYLLAPGGQVQHISPTQDRDINNANPSDLGGTQYLDDSEFQIFHDPYFKEAVVVANGYLVRWNYEKNAWHHWTLEGLDVVSGAYVPSASGVADTWLICSDSDGVYSWGNMDETVYTDNGVDFSSQVQTAWNRPDGGNSQLGWFSVRSPVLLGRVLVDDGGVTNSSVTVTVDMDDMTSGTSSELFAFTAGRSESIAPDTKWPTDRFTPELSLARQKCSMIRLTITASPAIVAFNQVELQVKPAAKIAPTNQRG